jgi:hypothetical protein
MVESWNISDGWEKETQVTLRFVDALNDASGCTLDQFTQDYTEIKVVEE